MQAELERRCEESELAHSARGYNTHQSRNQGRWQHNSLGRGSVQDKRTTEEGRHESWVFYQSGTRREFLFTSKGLIKGQQNEKEIDEKKEKSNSKISLNEVIRQGCVTKPTRTSGPNNLTPIDWILFHILDQQTI